MLKYRMIVMLAALSLALGGCFGPKPEEELYLIFEKAAKQEKEMFQMARNLEQLEKQNQELYHTILQDGKEDNQPVKSIIEQAIQSIQEREKTLDAEYDILTTAQNEMKDSNKYIAEIKERNLKESAQKVESLFKERYIAFQDMRDVYKTALAKEKVLYDMLQAKGETLKVLAAEVKAVNKLYKDVEEKNEIFNSYTKQYNAEKIAFYKHAEFKIKQEQ